MPRPSGNRIRRVGTATPSDIRSANADDRAFVIETVRRLPEFGVPPGRTPEEIVSGEVRMLSAYFDAPPEGSTLLIAEGSGRERLGFAYLETETDFFTRRQHGHLRILAVTRAAEGRGVGGALLSASESWAKARGYATLTLNVFASNRRARDVYERRGYSPESLRYTKLLG